jgi:hypothetical protein
MYLGHILQQLGIDTNQILMEASYKAADLTDLSSSCFISLFAG